MQRAVTGSPLTALTAVWNQAGDATASYGLIAEFEALGWT
jgi:hypothetical protein